MIERFSKKQKIIFSSIFITSLFIIRLYFAIPPENIPADKFIGEQVNFSGVIVAEPDKRSDSTRYTIKSEGNLDHMKVLITANRFPEFYYGDLVTVEGKIERPEEFETDLGRTFDYPNYLAKDGIRYVIFRPELSLVEKGHGSRLISTLFYIKKKFVQNIENALPEPHSSLANGITLGLKQSLGKELLDVFRRVGIIHIVVLSGYNMTIILSGVIYSLGRLPLKFSRGVTLLFAAILTLAFSALVGFSATVLRASVMALLAILARFLGRPILAMRTLFIAGAAMLFWNPLILFYDPSFQLSFLATFGLLALAPIIERKFRFLSSISGVSSKWKQVGKEIFTATLATQIFVLPAIIYMTGQFSIISLPVNLLVLPLIPTAMIFTGISGVLGMILPIIGKVAAFPAYIILEFIIKLSEIAANFPLAAISVKSIPLWLVFLVYVGYGWYLWKERVIEKSSRSPH